MTGPVPVARSLQEIYPEDALSSQSKRWNALLSIFESRHGHPADFVSRSPGRVNIIGEHIDYSLYSVLPMAITADTLLAVSVYDGPASDSTFKVHISNVQADKYPAREFDVPVDGHVDIDATQHEWSNYFRSGLRGALELLLRKNHGHSGGSDFRPKSMKIVVDGAVPIGAGLSSSAAFVTSSALAVTKANGYGSVDKTELTELAIVSERAVGVNSGGYVFFFFSPPFSPFSLFVRSLSTNTTQNGPVGFSLLKTRRRSLRLLCSPPDRSSRLLPHHQAVPRFPHRPVLRHLQQIRHRSHPL